MIAAAGFLGTAKGRLLPASIPFRFFGAACVCQVLAWAAALAGAEALPAFAGGLGLPLSALHLLTLGVLAMTAIGASLQLLPVATRQPVARPLLLAMLWWLFSAGVAAATAGMAFVQPHLLAGGVALLLPALLLYAVLLVRNLAGARGMPEVLAHTWVAALSLLLLLGSGASLALDYAGLDLLPRPPALALHVAFAGYGFMGMLLMGFSYVLVPMFAVADSPPRQRALLSAALATLGLVCAALVAFGVAPRIVNAAAAAFGLAGFGLHLQLMLRALAGGMRKVLGPSFVLVRVGWALLLASLLAALALALDAPMPRLDTLFVVLLIGGLVTALAGMLSRIVPFLASMHAAPGRRGPPAPSTLSAARPLAWHFHGHLAALALLLAAVLLDQAWLVRGAAVAGLVSALAFGVFVAEAWRRLRRPAAV